MATFLREALRKPSHLIFLSTCAHQKPTYFPLPPHVLHKPHLGQPGFDHHRNLLNPNTDPRPPPEARLALDDTATKLPPFFPSFSLSYFLNPNADQFVDATVDVEEGLQSDDSGVMRADSVKKKRKKKMNKHKYKKLRKSLRLKT